MQESQQAGTGKKKSRQAKKQVSKKTVTVCKKARGTSRKQVSSC